MRRTTRLWQQPSLPLLGDVVAKLQRIPARSPSFANRAGPVAWLGIDDQGNRGAAVLRTAMTQYGHQSPSDFYTDVQWHDEASLGAKPLEAPPLSITVTPVVDCGVLERSCASATPAAMAPTSGTHPFAAMDAGAGAAAMYPHIRAASAALTEKGYIPFFVGGSISTVLPCVEGVHSVVNEDVVVVHFSGDTGMNYDSAPLKVLLEKRIVKGIFQFGTRGASSTARAVRKEHQVRYIDASSIYAKGTFTVKDIRNDFPIFLSFDASVLDPAFAPGVFMPEPGGLTTRDALHLLSVIRGPRIVGAALTGFEPRLDVRRGDAGPEHSLTAVALTKVAKEIILKAYAISSKTAAEGMAHVQELKKQGQHPERYPDF